MLFITIKKEDRRTITKQLYDEMRQAIIKGKIHPEERLPSTRDLAKELHIARNIVIEVYEQLMDEGYLYTRKGSGTYVGENILIDREEKIEIQKMEELEVRKTYQTSFRTGIPELGSIPLGKWANVYKNAMLELSGESLDYQNPMGNMELRIQISEYLNKVRGCVTVPQNILITNGAAQAFYLLSRVVQKKEYALVENPISYGVRHTLERNQVRIQPVSVDSQGIRIDELPEKPPKLIFTTPSHQFPTGVIMPAGRRMQLLSYARQKNCYVVEDDYDSEFRFDGKPIQAMQYLAPERVIYVGTFSKTLMPSLRIGYLVLPESLIEEMKELKYVQDIHSANLEQIALAHFIKLGFYEQHIRKMKKIYLKKRDYIVNCLKQEFGEAVRIEGVEAGLHFMAVFSGRIFDSEKMQEIENAGIEITAVNKHYIDTDIKGKYDNALLFGYGNTNLQKVEAAIKQLAEIMR